MQLIIFKSTHKFNNNKYTEMGFGVKIRVGLLYYLHCSMYATYRTGT